MKHRPHHHHKQHQSASSSSSAASSRKGHHHPLVTGPCPFALVSIPSLTGVVSSSSIANHPSRNSPQAIHEVRHDRVTPGVPFNLAVKQQQQQQQNNNPWNNAKSPAPVAKLAEQVKSIEVITPLVKVEKEIVSSKCKVIAREMEEDVNPIVDEKLIDSLKGRSWFDIAEEENKEFIVNNSQEQTPMEANHQPRTILKREFPSSRFSDQNVGDENNSLRYARNNNRDGFTQGYRRRGRNDRKGSGDLAEHQEISREIVEELKHNREALATNMGTETRQPQMSSSNRRGRGTVRSFRGGRGRPVDRKYPRNQNLDTRKKNWTPRTVVENAGPETN